MRSFVYRLTLGLSLFLTMPAFGRTCGSAHILDLVADGRIFRRQALLPDDFPDWIPGPYVALGALGQSRQVAMLAERDGQLFVVKFNHFPNREVYRNLWREMAVTEFFNSAGENLPKILSFIHGPGGQLAVVKNYEEGIVGSELRREGRFLSRHFDNLERYRMESELKKTITRLRDLFHKGHSQHPSFLTWYRDNLERLSAEHPQLFELAMTYSPREMQELSKAPKDDINKQNMIYSFNEKKWKILDP